MKKIHLESRISSWKKMSTFQKLKSQTHFKFNLLWVRTQDALNLVWFKISHSHHPNLHSLLFIVIRTQIYLNQGFFLLEMLIRIKKSLFIRWDWKTWRKVMEIFFSITTFLTWIQPHQKSSFLSTPFKTNCKILVCWLVDLYQIQCFFKNHSSSTCSSRSR